MRGGATGDRSAASFHAAAGDGDHANAPAAGSEPINGCGGSVPFASHQKGNPVMKPIIATALLALLAAPLAACGGNGDDKLAGQVKDQADNRADQLEAMADNLEEQADQTRKVGEQRADAIDAADVNAHAMSNEQKVEIINNEAAAVR
jgi:hypothetical protein